MLSRIKIKKLFNLYDYDINLVNSDGSKIKFITAPNGFGKTTILDFIDSVMKRDFECLFRMPFEKFILYYNEESLDAVYQVVIVRKDEKSQAVDTDFNITLSKVLEVSLIYLTDCNETLIECNKVTLHPDGLMVTEGNTGNTEMFFAHRTSYYLTDKRLHKLKTDVDKKILSLGFFSMSQYVEKMKEILESPVKSKENKDRIEAFKRIIDRCEFANKHLEIDKRFGFRFVADDALETKLSFDQLSSGEKHIIIQVFELLFLAKEGTLVLIDEPELSLHMMWQMNYLKNLEEMVALRGFQCIIATHSPQIFNSLWSKSVDLFSIANQKDHDAIA